MIVALVDDEMPAFEELTTSCLKLPKEILWAAVETLTAQGCIIKEYTTPPAGGLPAGGHHRRLQGLNFHHGLDTKECPMDNFSERVADIDSTCCVQGVTDVCAGGVPTACDLPCAAAFVPFYNVSSLLGVCRTITCECRVAWIGLYGISDRNVRR
jgi:hypothetical protein